MTQWERNVLAAAREFRQHVESHRGLFDFEISLVRARLMAAICPAPVVIEHRPAPKLLPAPKVPSETSTESQ